MFPNYGLSWENPVDRATPLYVEALGPYSILCPEQIPVLIYLEEQGRPGRGRRKEEGEGRQKNW